MSTKTDDLARALAHGVEGEVRFDAASRMLYRTDASIYEIEPQGIVIPRTSDDVVHVVRTAAERHVPVLPRGAGTSLAGQSVGQAIHVDFSKYLNQIMELNVQEGWVRVQPGVVLDELNAFLRPHGLMFGPDVSTSSRANIGGMIGSNSSGTRSIRYGKTVDHVLGLDVVLADGSTAHVGPVDRTRLAPCFARGGLEGTIYRDVHRLVAENVEEIEARYPKVMRRVSGYNLDELSDPAGPFDLSKIVVGSEGTLCMVTEARLRVVPVPACTVVVACHFGDLSEAMRATVEVVRTGATAVELADRLLLDLTKGSVEHARRRAFLVGDPDALLLVEYAAQSEEEIRRKVDELQVHLAGCGLGYAFVEAFPPAEQRDMWELRKAGLGILMGMRGAAKPTSGLEDTCVPVEALPEYVDQVGRLMQESGLQATFYGHASVGVLHIRPVLNLKTAEGIALLRHLEERICDIVLKFGGSLSAEHGDGLARSEWIEKMFGPRMVRAFESVKDAFDPHGIMNPGKIVRPQRMDENLRYGPDYRTVPVETFFGFDREGGFQEAAEMCSGVGQCRKLQAGTMCPSYMATMDEKHSTRGRANALRAALNGRPGFPQGLASHELYKIMDLCLECKACKAECPSGVDVAKLKYEFLAQYSREHGYSLRSRMIGSIHRVNRWMFPVSGLANRFLRSQPVRWLLHHTVGIDKRRQMPALASQRFSTWFGGRMYRRGGTRGKVVLYNDTYVEYNDPQIGMAATFVLESAGFEVVIPAKQLCCGRPLISKGLLPKAKATARHTVDGLIEYVQQGWPIVGLEPSCMLTFRDDYLDLIGDHPGVQAVAEGTYMLEEFLAQLASEGRLDIDFTSTSRQILFHGHCHQKALVGTAATLQILGMPPNFRVEEIDSGCCGMAGAFGYEKEHYDLSMKVGEERLFKAIREAPADTVIVAAGTSCRQQIADGTDRRARHWTEVLVEAL